MAAAGHGGDRPSPVAKIRVRVAPGARRSQLVGRHGDGWKLRVQAPPERGKANDQVRELLAGIAGIRPRDVEIVTGAASRDKLVAVHGVDSSLLERMLDAASGK